MTEFEYNYDQYKDKLGLPEEYDNEEWSKFAYYIYNEWHYLPSEFIKTFDQQPIIEKCLNCDTEKAQYDIIDEVFSDRNRNCRKKWLPVFQ